MLQNVVTDGTIIFENYGWDEEKNIVSKITGNKLKGDKSQNYCNYCLYEKDGKYRRERNILLRYSFPEMYVPQDKENWMDVFGYEDMYCLNINNPNIIWSKMKGKVDINPYSTKYGHLFFTPKGNQYLIHHMVWESYNKKKCKGKKYNIHHINMNKEDNRIQNLLLLPANIHHSYHNIIDAYFGKSNFKNYSIEYNEVLKTINSYKISNQEKEILKNNFIVKRLTEGVPSESEL